MATACPASRTALEYSNVIDRERRRKTSMASLTYPATTNDLGAESSHRGDRHTVTSASSRLEQRPLPVVLAVRNFLALFEHVCFGLVVGNIYWRRGLLTILGVMVGIFVVGVLVLGVAIGAGCHAESLARR
jgi:hypothetical protein